MIEASPGLPGVLPQLNSETVLPGELPGWELPGPLAGQPPYSHPPVASRCGGVHSLLSPSPARKRQSPWGQAPEFSPPLWAGIKCHQATGPTATASSSRAIQRAAEAAAP